jgi:HD-GYP domain-containing protein (c-di-GMP phosphodiesterase class II)
MKQVEEWENIKNHPYYTLIILFKIGELGKMMKRKYINNCYYPSVLAE